MFISYRKIMSGLWTDSCEFLKDRKGKNEGPFVRGMIGENEGFTEYAGGGKTDGDEKT